MKSVGDVPVDFEQRSLPEQLALSGFLSDEPVIVSWMAVTQYLSREAVSKTLRQVANCASGSRIVFTYDVPRHDLDGRDQPAFDRVTSFAAEVGEPFVSL